MLQRKHIEEKWGATITMMNEFWTFKMGKMAQATVIQMLGKKGQYKSVESIFSYILFHISYISWLNFGKNANSESLLDK